MYKRNKNPWNVIKGGIINSSGLANRNKNCSCSLYVLPNDLVHQLLTLLKAIQQYKNIFLTRVPKKKGRKEKDYCSFFCLGGLISRNTKHLQAFSTYKDQAGTTCAIRERQMDQVVFLLHEINLLMCLNNKINF